MCTVLCLTVFQSRFQSNQASWSVVADAEKDNGRGNGKVFWLAVHIYKTKDSGNEIDCVYAHSYNYMCVS